MKTETDTQTRRWRITWHCSLNTGELTRDSADHLARTHCYPNVYDSMTYELEELEDEIE